MTLGQTESLSEASVWALFRDSFDVFSVVLLLGSMVAVSLIVRLVMGARGSVISPEEIVHALSQELDSGDLDSFLAAASDDSGIVVRLVLGRLMHERMGRRRCGRRRRLGRVMLVVVGRGLWI